MTAFQRRLLGMPNPVTGINPPHNETKPQPRAHGHEEGAHDPDCELCAEAEIARQDRGGRSR